jgi:hypothetical protein
MLLAVRVDASVICEMGLFEKAPLASELVLALAGTRIPGTLLEPS